MSANSFRGTDPTFARPQSLDFYVWGHLKSLVHSASITNKETLHQRIYLCLSNHSQLPGTLERVKQSMIKGVRAGTDSGGHFEYLL